MRIILAMLKIRILKVYITVFAMVMVLMRIKYGWMGIDFIRQNMELIKNPYRDWLRGIFLFYILMLRIW